MEIVIARAALALTEWTTMMLITSGKQGLLSDSISTPTTLSDAILHLITKHRLNATIRQC